MATTIMSIGFSVDFPAHITFHYYREGIEAPDSTPARRVAKATFGIVERYAKLLKTFCYTNVTARKEEWVHPHPTAPFIDQFGSGKW
ncbi:unnamed protein product [Nippostrongylus brasiliensis]|uniref:Transposase n=1 Tax=Nippostrongylus brasiliensis TaxID=27835 RepID=A0A0N4YYN5_NIPBR|nr:unnamed protein product [Nippostrongylus brasiliensis]